MNKLIIVTGTGRCGTSAVGRMLNVAGLPTGPDFAADDTNPHGFFEDSRVVAVHERIKAGDTSRLQEYKGYLKGRVAATDAVVKDPRYCDPGVWDAVEELLPEPRLIVLCERDTEDVVESLVRAYNMPRNRALQLAITRRNRGRAIAWNEKSLLLEFADLHNQPGLEAQRLADFLGVDQHLVPKMAAAIDKTLWRCRATQEPG